MNMTPKGTQGKARALKRKKRGVRGLTDAEFERKLAALEADTDQKVAALLSLAGDESKPRDDRIRAYMEFGKMTGIAERMLRNMAVGSDAKH